MSRGGAGRGQGRRPVPVSFGEMIEIGSRCKYLLHGQRLEVATKRMEKLTPDLVKDAQRDIRAKRTRGAKAVQETRSEVTRKALTDLAVKDHDRAMKRVKNEIAPALDKIGRFLTRKKYMPKRLTLEQVRQQVAREWQAKGRADITARRVKDIWAEFNKLESDVRAHLDSMF